MKKPSVLNALGLVLIIFGLISLSPLLVAIPEKEFGSMFPFAVTASLAVAVGILLILQKTRGKNIDNLKRRDGLFVVTMTWIVASVIGAIPYLFYGLSPVDALFESVSGFTTTGATVFLDFTRYPKDLFFWRSLSQWLGGMGIIVLFVAILPQFAVAGRKIFFAEAPGPIEEKITPRITSTAKALWLIYFLLTMAEIILLALSGMPLFDAVCNSFSTMAAGGFSPHAQSIMGYHNSAAIWIITLFMFFAGSNFALQYRLLIQFKPQSLLRSEEFRLYTFIVFGMSLLLALILYLGHTSSLAIAIRDALFQVLSILTTTGFSSADFSLWQVPAQVILLLVMLVGGCAGSAGGGIKVVRILYIAKFLKREIAQTLHPQAVLPVKLDGTTISETIQRQMLGFVLFYIAILVCSGLLVTAIEGDAGIGFIGTVATIGNIGPGFGEIGPMGSFGNLSTATKLIFTVDMLVGRLELIPFLVMLHPSFWRD